MTEPRFIPGATAEELRRERARARELRQSAWWRRRIASGRCHYCGHDVGPRGLTLDHIVPLIRGGRSVKSNMVPACKACNTAKQSLLPWEWEAWAAAHRPAGDPDRSDD